MRGPRELVQLREKRKISSAKINGARKLTTATIERRTTTVRNIFLCVSRGMLVLPSRSQDRDVSLGRGGNVLTGFPMSDPNYSKCVPDPNPSPLGYTRGVPLLVLRELCLFPCPRSNQAVFVFLITNSHRPEEQPNLRQDAVLGRACLSNVRL